MHGLRRHNNRTATVIKLHLLLRSNWLTCAWGRTAGGTLLGGAMASRSNQGPRGSLKAFRAVARQACRGTDGRLRSRHGKAQVVASLESIADACDVLRSAIAGRAQHHSSSRWFGGSA